MNYLNWKILLFLCLFKLGKTGFHENRLISDIFSSRDHTHLGRPVKNEIDALIVTFGLSLQSIIGVDEKKEMLQTSMYLNYEWYDYNLAWNSSEYGGVKNIRLPYDKLWTPDILLYNSAHEKIDTKYPANVIVTSEGKCRWLPLGIFSSSCQINIRYFPFDEQYCKMKFGSWTHDGILLNLSLSEHPFNTGDYQENGEWDLLVRDDEAAERNVIRYKCCPEPYIDITYTIHIRRKVLYYGYNLILPCALVSTLSVFNFILPPDTNAKVSLGITILLALSVFQMIVADMVPSTSLSVPLVAIYFSSIMVMCTISLIFTIIVINFHHRKPEMYKMSPFVEKYILNYLAWFMRMPRPGRKITSPFKDAGSSPVILGTPTTYIGGVNESFTYKGPPPSSTNSYIIKQGNIVARPQRDSLSPSMKYQGNSNAPPLSTATKNKRDVVPNSVKFQGNSVPPSACLRKSNFHMISLASSAAARPKQRSVSANEPAAVSRADQKGSSTHPSNPPKFNNIITALHKQKQCYPKGSTQTVLIDTKQELNAILFELKFLTGHIKECDIAQDIVNDWKFAAMVVDRFCLLIFTLYLVVATMGIFLSSPNFRQMIF